MMLILITTWNTDVIGGSCELLSAAKCGFSHYKCTGKKKEATSLQPNFRRVTAWAESKKTHFGCKCVFSKWSKCDGIFGSSTSSLSLNAISCHLYFWNAYHTNFTVRMQMDDAQCRVFSSNYIASLADQDLFILFARKGSHQDTMRSLHRWSTWILRFYGADQKRLTQNLMKLCLWSTMQVDEQLWSVHP